MTAPAIPQLCSGNGCQAGERHVHVAPQLEPLVVPIGELRAHPKNARRGVVEAVAASLQRFGQQKPVVVQDATGYIVAGNHLMKAAKSIGWTHLAASRENLDDHEAEAFMLADNRTADLGGYDEEQLAQLLEAQDATGSLAGTGYTRDDLDRILRGLKPGRTEADEAPPPPAERDTWVKPGDLFQLGEHRLICGDSTAAETWDRLMAGERAQLVWTDPPYGVAYTGGTAERLRIENDGKDRDALEQMLEGAFRQALRFLDPGRGVYCASPGGVNAVTFVTVLDRLGIYRQTIVWVKDAFVLSRADYHSRHELIHAGTAPGEAEDPKVARGMKEGQPLHYGWRPGAKHYFVDDRTLDTVWEVDRPRANREHPTMKPVALIERSLLASTRGDELVVDCFGGSGSTLIAAETAGRRCNVIELDPRYVQVILERWEAFTGRKAEPA